MTPHEHRPRALYFWHVLAGPLAGAVVMAWVFSALVRPQLPGPAWLLDGATVLCSVAGLVIGGTLAFSRIPRPAMTDVAARSRAMLLPAAAVGLVVALTATPSLPVVIGGAIIVMTVLIWPSRAR